MTTNDIEFWIAGVNPFYTVYKDNKTHNFSTLECVANFLNTNISNIYHYLDGKRVKSISDDIKIYKEPTPYLYCYKGNRHTASKVKDICNTTGYSMTKVHSIITKYIIDDIKSKKLSNINPPLEKLTN